MPEMKCPKCENSTLERKSLNDVTVDVCPVCKGVWLGKGELDIITHPHEGSLEYCSTELIEEDRRTEYICPECDADSRLSRVNFVEYSDILMETCRECHGIWLDRGELDAINAEVDKLNEIEETWQHKIMVFLSKLPF